MTQQTRHDSQDGTVHGAYTPDSDRREVIRREDDRASFWRRLPFQNIGIIGALGISTFSALGFRTTTPSEALKVEAAARIAAIAQLAHQDTLQSAAQAAAIDRVTARADSNDKRFERIEDRLTYTNFLQCEQLRSSGSQAISPRARTDCDEIIRVRLAR
jgi:hypothetical protein